MFSIILAVIGFLLTYDFSGAIFGFFVGRMLDSFWGNYRVANESPEESYEYYRTRQQRQSNQNQRRGQTGGQDFTTMLMVLSAAVMRADGKVLKSELNYVKAYFRQNLGNNFDVKHLQVLKHYLKTPGIPLREISMNIRTSTKMQDRILILQYLFGIAEADGEIVQAEVDEIYTISNFLGISYADFMRVQNMFISSVDSDYKVLGIEESATNDEIKKKYRELAKEYHPDKVVHLGEAHQNKAKEQFQKIQTAYENLKKKRGFV